ncbi:MAG: ADP compounds hydrolase NudE [Gammaproteobacteria bacterium]|nr:ADP compounds hydrolase NudE [Gammaproteobacteria bacterium]
MMRKKPEILQIKTLSSDEMSQQAFRIEELHLKFSNGVERYYRRMQGSGQGAVLVVPITDDNQVLLIREYSVGVDRYELQLPKGRVDLGEHFLAAANRELKEEIGFGAKQLDHINTLSVLPGFMGHQTHIIIARGLYPERLEGDEPEELEVVPWPLTNIYELSLQENCSEARSIAALYMARDWLMREPSVTTQSII